jgi:hypothetical protein
MASGLAVPFATDVGQTFIDGQIDFTIKLFGQVYGVSLDPALGEYVQNLICDFHNDYLR